MGANSTDRRALLKGAAALVGLGLVSAIEGCAPAAPTPAPAAASAAPPTPTPAAGPMAQVTPTQAAAATATTAPAGAPATPTTAAPAIKYADKAAVMRFMTGGFTTVGSDDELV